MENWAYRCSVSALIAFINNEIFEVTCRFWPLKENSRLKGWSLTGTSTWDTECTSSPLLIWAFFTGLSRLSSKISMINLKNIRQLDRFLPHEGRFDADAWFPVMFIMSRFIVVRNQELMRIGRIKNYTIHQNVYKR